MGKSNDSCEDRDPEGVGAFEGLGSPKQGASATAPMRREWLGNAFHKLHFSVFPKSDTARYRSVSRRRHLVFLDHFPSRIPPPPEPEPQVPGQLGLAA